MDKIKVPISGGGPFVWQTKRIGSPEEFTAECEAHGWAHAAFKVMNRSGSLRDKDIKYYKSIKPLLYDVRCVPWPWVYINTEDAYARGAKFARLCVDLEAVVAGVNAEIEFKQNGGWGLGENGHAARAWIRGFRESGGADICLILSTFAQESLHRSFPYGDFLRGCDAVGPQCYGDDPVKQLIEAQDTAEKHGVALFPTLRAYLGDGIFDTVKVAKNIREMRAAMDEIDNCPACNWWEADAVQRYSDIEVALYFENRYPTPPKVITPPREGAFKKIGLGSRGDNVKDFQRLLKMVGLYEGNLDGAWGPRTEAAFRRYVGLTISTKGE